jgi:predicted nucleotidyltransferase
MLGETNVMVFDTSLWEKIIEAKRSRREEERLNFLNELVARLKRYFKGKRVRHVYLIGSILREGGFYNFSDIDIVVEKLEEDYFKVLTELEELIDRDVDLIELERCRFKESVRKYGTKVV